jgi:hypothetical protein
VDGPAPRDILALGARRLVRYLGSMANEPEDPVLVELRSLRRELAALLEHQTTFARQQTKIVETLEEIRRQIGDARSEIVLLESHNITRHTEILAILRRLEDVEQQQTTTEQREVSGWYQSDQSDWETSAERHKREEERPPKT